MLATSHLSDAGCYDLVWASNIVTRAWQRLQNEFVAEGKAEWLEELRPFVAGGSITPPNQEEDQDTGDHHQDDADQNQPSWHRRALPRDDAIRNETL